MAVLLRVYAKCVYGQEEAAKRRIEAALALDEIDPLADTYTTQQVGRSGSERA